MFLKSLNGGKEEGEGEKEKKRESGTVSRGKEDKVRGQTRIHAEES